MEVWRQARLWHIRVRAQPWRLVVHLEHETFEVLRPNEAGVLTIATEPRVVLIFVPSRFEETDTTNYQQRAKLLGTSVFRQYSNAQGRCWIIKVFCECQCFRPVRNIRLLDAH